MSPVLSLPDVGYRRFGPLPAAGEGLEPERAAGVAAQFSDYEAAGAWVRRRARQKNGRFINSFQIVDVLDKHTVLTDERLGFVDDYFRSEFANAHVPKLTAESDILLDLAKSAAEEPRWLGMYRLEQALAYAGSQRLKPLLREHVVPCFFQLYPEGKIAVVCYNPENDDAAALMRTLYTAAQAPLQEVRKEAFRGLRTLQDWHLNSLSQLGPLLLDLFLYLFYPFIGGYRGGPAGLDFVFLFEPAERYTPAVYPRNWLAVASTAADFGREQVDLYETLKDVQGPAWQHAAHQRFQHQRGYTVTERLALLEWYIERLNRLLYELTDVANFTEGHDPQSPIDPVFAFEHHLTVDRLARKTLQSMSLEEAGVAKHLVFEVAELYDGMSKLFGNHVDASSFFKGLFHPEDGSALLRERLARLPAPFGTDLAGLVDQLYRRIEDTVIGSIWLRSKVTADGVMVRRRKDLTQEELVPRPKFVSELMRAYRNAHHGYFTDADDQHKRPSRYLFLTDGNLPAEMTALPALWWLACLADPEMVGWKHLPIGEYD